MGKLLHLPAQEQKLIKQCRKGKARAQRELYERYGAQMLAVCRRYCGTQEDAEEVLSNAFLKIFKKIDQYTGQGPLGGWMRTIMVREALNFIRYQKNFFVEADEERQPEMGHEPATENYKAEHLMQLIDELPLGYKTVFNLYAIEGYAHKEIAQMLDISENTSKTQLRKARKELQHKLKDEEILYREQ